MSETKPNKQIHNNINKYKEVKKKKRSTQSRICILCRCGKEFIESWARIK